MCSEPAARALNLTPPLTARGTLLPRVLPSPSWPAPLSPQHHAAPSPVRPHVCRAPAVSITKLWLPATGAGAGGPAVRPFPSCPLAFNPQQTALPPEESPQVWSPPATRAAKPLAPLTITGAFVEVPAPASPSCPVALSPQHTTAPLCVIPQEWAPPDATLRRGSRTELASVAGAGWGAGWDSLGCGGAGEGVTATGGGAGAAGTVTVADPVTPSLVAVIVALPPATAVTDPEADTVAIAGVLEDQVTSRSFSAPPRASRNAAVSCAFFPMASVSVAGVTATLATGTALTVTAAEALCDSICAVIVA